MEGRHTMQDISEEFDALIKIRASKSEVFFGTSNDPVIDREIELFTRNISETIKFLRTKCTAEQFGWMSEIFNEVVDTTQSREFVDALFELTKKYPDITRRLNIQSFVEEAEHHLR